MITPDESVDAMADVDPIIVEKSINGEAYLAAMKDYVESRDREKLKKLNKFSGQRHIPSASDILSDNQLMKVFGDNNSNVKQFESSVSKSVDCQNVLYFLQLHQNWNKISRASLRMDWNDIDPSKIFPETAREDSDPDGPFGAQTYLNVCIPDYQRTGRAISFLNKMYSRQRISDCSDENFSLFLTAMKSKAFLKNVDDSSGFNQFAKFLFAHHVNVTKLRTIIKDNVLSSDYNAETSMSLEGAKELYPFAEEKQLTTLCEWLKRGERLHFDDLVSEEKVVTQAFEYFRPKHNIPKKFLSSHFDQFVATHNMFCDRFRQLLNDPIKSSVSPAKKYTKIEYFNWLKSDQLIKDSRNLKEEILLQLFLLRHHCK